MSFSSEVKEELSRINANSCCQRAELSALIRMAGTIRIIGGQSGVFLQIQTVHAPTARRIFKLLKIHFHKPTEIAIKRNNFLKDRSMYIILLNLEDAKDLLTELGILDKDKEKITLQKGIDHSILKKDCCKKAYLRGAFLGGGSISNPKGPYHMEYVTPDKILAYDLKNLINELGLNAKVVVRKNNYMVYLKEGNNISDMLGNLGAHNSLFKFEDIRVLKGMRNSVNRLVNCETANINKTIGTSFRQIKAIKFLIDNNLFNNLPMNLKQIAEIRLDYPDLSLKELGQMLIPPLSKSGVSYRLKKIEQIAEREKLMKDNEGL